MAGQYLLVFVQRMPAESQVSVSSCLTVSLSPPRYFYRACQSTLFPSPVQIGRQLDKIPAEVRRNILTLGRVKASSPPLGPRPNFLPLAKHNTKDPSFHNTGESQTDRQAHAADTLPYTKDAGRAPEGPDLRPPGWVTSTPLMAPADGVQLELLPDKDSQSVKYTRSSMDGQGRGLAVPPSPSLPPHRTEQEAQHLLHTTLWYLTVSIVAQTPICTISFVVVVIIVCGFWFNVCYCIFQGDSFI